ncbi:MAG TPA: lipoyl(octanoyl) transferase LipB [Nitrososphaerales archaeon]|jgi:lipoate-protein ligase B|nr:lipoyl(octanoyl) transferase LipB [Nitrososphaerales archaeon]NSL73872.1 lipoyl(octanoyl) transferase LipB [Nitrososphaerota archaeon]NSL74945.1 lipoyl(octanoyl) transferase LipB [Nitrososphaerota archaeon]NSL76941.1 lipoyl(octanoyl) transferase LipB [Nitrososphaerota archaeon]HIC84094.1 lipoyl(octanoyl) transferase LipB [Nitrososphaerales archaeon]|tara:strand:- start:540 stop:1193 length:654 start_codon:yes stop_codon:yes gene_type:complete
MNRLNIIDLGLTEYQRALDIQKTLVKKRLDDSVTDTLLLLEHPHVITLGRQTKPGDVLDNSMPIVEIDRGGSATYHGPGQLIGYVIIDLRRKGISVPTLITKIHESLIRTLSELDIKAERKRKKPGVWIEQKKIASIGLSVRNWITYHGFSLNIDTDLDKFKIIRPCGFDSQIMTSINYNKKRKYSMEIIKSSIIRNFVDVFEYYKIEKKLKASYSN